MYHSFHPNSCINCDNIHEEMKSIFSCAVSSAHYDEEKNMFTETIVENN